MEASWYLQWLEQEIERLRTELYQVVAVTPFALTHSQTLAKSKRLDQLIVEWTRLTQNISSCKAK